MPLTVEQVVALPELGLIIHTGDVPLDREVRWVAVSEHIDPTPWLAAGDLLLTTGIAFDAEAANGGAYVERLVAAGIAGLGFGTGPIRLPHQHVPPALVAAAHEAGLPLFEVPEPVPFVALSKAVSRLLAAEEYAESAAAFDSQRRLLRAALSDDDRPAADAILRIVARHVAGFALLVDAGGQVQAAQPPDAAARGADFTAEIERIRPRGLRGSASLATVDEHVSILPVGIRGADAFLVVGAARPVRPADQGVLALAVSLLAWPAPRDPGHDAWRMLLVRHARLAGLDPALLSDLGLDGIDPSHAAAVVVRLVPDGGAPREPALPPSTQIVLATGPGGWEGFVAVDTDRSLPAPMTALRDTPGVEAVGVSAPLDLREPANVEQALDQARRAARGRGLRRYDDGPAASITDLLDAARAEAWAREYLGSLGESDEGRELMETVHAWLGSHGQVDAAAGRLGIHRHTVRHRLRRAELLLGRSLDDPQVRADLWFALQATMAT